MSNALLAQMVHTLQELQHHQRSLLAARRAHLQVLTERVGVAVKETNNLGVAIEKVGPVTTSILTKLKSLNPGVRYEEILLFHHQKQSAIVAQAAGVESGRKHVWILVLSAWQQRDVCCERPIHSDHVGVSGYSSGQDSKVSAQK